MLCRTGRGVREEMPIGNLGDIDVLSCLQQAVELPSRSLCRYLMVNFGVGVGEVGGLGLTGESGKRI